MKKIKLNKYTKVTEFNEGLVCEVFFCSNNAEVSKIVKEIEARGHLAVKG